VAKVASGSTVFLVAYAFLCVRFALLFPASTQHSILMVGQTLPDRDFHPARDIEPPGAHRITGLQG